MSITVSSIPSKRPSVEMKTDDVDFPTQLESLSTEKITRQPKSFKFWLAFIGLVLSVFIVSLDATSLSPSIPVIAKSLSGTTLESFWASISFLLVQVVTQPLYTSLSDIFGRKIPLNFAFICFGIGCIIFGTATSMKLVILGRTIQGLGAAGLDVLGEIIVADITTLKERPLYLGLLSIPMAVGTILGPILGAQLAERVSWHWIGWVNLPITAIGFVLCFFFLSLKPIDQTWRSKIRQIDYIGMILFAIGLTNFVLPLSWTGALYPWSSWRTLLPFILGAFVLLGLAFYEKRPAVPVFPARLFKSRTAQVTLCGSFCHGLIVYCLLFYMPIYFEGVQRASPIRAAVLVLPLLTAVVVFSGLSTVVVELSRGYRWNIWSGWVFLSVGLGVMSLLNERSSLLAQSGYQILIGVGIGTLYCVLALPMQASAPSVDDQGLAVGILVFFRLLGAVVGLAIGSAVFNNTFQHHLNNDAVLPPTLAFLRNANEAIAFVPSLKYLNVDAPVLSLLLGAYSAAVQNTWLTLAAFAASAFVASLFMAQLTLESDDLGRQQFVDE